MKKLQLPVLTRDELMSALTRTYQNAIVMKIHEFTTKNVGDDWIWFGGDPDEVLFSGRHSEKFESRISNKFSKWLNSVGWYCEHYDYGTYFLVPIADVPQVTLAQKDRARVESMIQREIKAGRIARHPANYCPF